MSRQASAPPKGPRPEHELEYPERDGLPQNPDARPVANTPATAPAFSGPSATRNIHTTANSFDGATLTDTGAFPPDSMGTVGPTQFIVFVNGRIRSFTKGGVADGVLNADPDVFFAPVMTPVSGSVVVNFTSDPQIRYDRFTARWYMSIIDVPCTNATCSATAANRWLLAVSDAASGGTITNATVWTLFEVQADPGTNFCDYPSLGIDVNALYFGCNIFSSAGSFVGTNGYVVQKSSVQNAGPMVVTMFANLAAGVGAGPESPRGVDNFDATATSGYFVGPDNATFSTIMFRRVSNPGSLTPTISANIAVTVPTTTIPNTVEHLGNTGGTNGKLDSLDDRFFQAMIRNGHLWTAHNFRVSAAGVANTAAQARNASRWYEFDNLGTTPTVLQSGTVFDNATTRAASLQYFIPTIAATGQDHAVLGFTMAGAVGATPSYVGRLAGDTLGTMTGPPTAAVVSFGTSAANYNPPSDPGGSGGRRWGDYSFTVVDPLDDMSVWTIQEYNQAANSYAVRVAQLKAPPPATPTCSTTPVTFSAGTGNVTIAATSTGGSGFYDPGTNLPTPALPFSHISASMTGGTVNSATFVSATSVTLNITATTPGLKSITITNPDGQSVTAGGCINVVSGAAAKLAFTTQPTNGVAGQTLTAVAVSVEDASGNVVSSDNTTQVTLTLSSNTLNGTLTKTAVNGVATFSDLSINTAGNGYTLSASSTPSLTGATSMSFNIAAAAASKLVFTQPPSNAAAGQVITPPITVTVEDAFGNVVASSTASVALAFGTNAGGTGAVLSGGGATAAVNGVATFSGVSINKVGTGYTLVASSAGLTSVTSSAFNITAGPAAKLAFTTQPGTNANVVAGATINLVVTVQDALGNTVTSDTSTVTIAIGNNPGGSTLSGTTSVQAVNGVASFSAAGLSLNKTGTGYTLVASDSTAGVTPATSNSFNIVPGAAASLQFVQQPTDIVAGAIITPPVTVKVLDASGNMLTSSVTVVSLSIASGPATTLFGGGAVNDSAGVATWNALSIHTAGTYTLSASSAGLPSITSTSFVVSAGALSQLVFTMQPPTTTTAGSPFDVTVQLQDQYGNVLTGNSTSLVSLVPGNNPGGDPFSGRTIPVVNGVAQFTGITFTKPGVGYTLRAINGATGLETTSSAFTVVAGSGAMLAFVQQPGNVTQGAALGTVTVEIEDASGNRIVTDNTTVVTLSIAACGGSIDLGTATAVNGVATFTPGSTFDFYTVASGLQLQASATPFTAATSTAFSVTANGDILFADGFDGCRL